MSLRNTIQALVLALTVAGCSASEDPEQSPDAAQASTDITGWYGTVTKLQGDCGSTADENLAPAFIYIDRLQSTSYVRGCQDMGQTDCPSLYYDFNEPVKDGWSAEGGSAFYSAECTLSWERSTATLIEGQLRVHTLKYGSVGAVTEAECNLTTAAALTDPCTYETELTATKL